MSGSPDRSEGSPRDRRSQRIRDQLRARPNPRAGQEVLDPPSTLTLLKRTYRVQEPVKSVESSVSEELARLLHRRTRS